MSHVRAGQIWHDNDTRMKDRKVKVLAVVERDGVEYAQVTPVHGSKKLHIRTSRMGSGPNGGKLAWTLDRDSEDS